MNRLPTSRRKRTLATLILAAIVPLFLFGALVLFLEAGLTRDAARRDVSNTLDRVVDRVTVALQKEVEIAEALAALPSLDKLDLERFYRTAQRIAPQRALWETVSIADPNGMQIMNILRKLGDPLGPVSDLSGFAQAVKTKRTVIGGIGPIGPVSGKRLISISVPVIRDGEVQNVLTIGVTPLEVQGILRQAGAPRDWIGSIIDANGRIIARSQDHRSVENFAPEAVKLAIAGGVSGQYNVLSSSGLLIETHYRHITTTNEWTVHFGIPTRTLNGPVSRSSIFLVLSCASCLLIAGGIVHYTVRDLEEQRLEREDFTALLLASSEQQTAVAIEAAELGTWRLDFQALQFSGSLRTKNLMNLGDAQRKGTDYVWKLQSFFDAVYPDDRKDLIISAQDAAQSHKQLDMEFRVLTADGDLRWIRLAGKTMPDPSLDKLQHPRSPVLRGVLADVHILKTSHTERVSLLIRLAEVQEDEQRRIARELHDQVGQTLTGLSLGLKNLERRLESEALRSSVIWLESLTSDVSRDIHRVAADLRPVALDDLGLIEALNAFAAELNRRHKIAFDVHAAGFTDRLSPKIENAVFRIVQEAFTNILKHSAATSASIIIEKHDDVLKIVIEDDGCGFELNFDAHRPEGNFKKWGANIGLSSIRERLAILDGRFRIETAVGHGVTLFIEIPLVREPVYS